MHASKTHVFEGASTRELMPLFADVEAFPSFVPGYKSAEVVEREGNQYKTLNSDEVQRPTSLNRLDIPSCQADCLPSKSGGSWGFETGTLFCR